MDFNSDVSVPGTYESPGGMSQIYSPLSGLKSYGNKSLSGAASPYLDIDPRIFQREPQYILPEGQSHKRGRFELAFAQIGGAVMCAGIYGGTYGSYLYYAARDSAKLKGFLSLHEEGQKVARATFLNSVGKAGANYAQSVGVVAVMYSAFGVLLSKLRGTDDELNTVMAGTACGALYKCTDPNRMKCVRGGAIGMGLSAAYALCTSENLKNWMRSKWA